MFMDKPRVTPKDFVLWLGAMAALYSGVIAFISLIFAYISEAFPNPVTQDYYYGYSNYGADVSYQMASLIVLTPVFMLLMRLIRRDIARDPSRSEIWVRRWALYLTLFLAAASMVIDLIVVIMTFLQGEEITVGFLLKVLTVLLVAGLGFMHFLADIRGYWNTQVAKARMVNWSLGVVVVVAILAGFFIIGTPQHIRERKQDATRVQDLQNIQWQIVSFWQSKGALPATLADLNDPIGGSVMPVDPVTREPYVYKRTGDLTFSLCTTFATDGDAGLGTGMMRPTVDPVLSGQDNWEHIAGDACFERTIDPERYPPYPKQL